MSLPQFSRAKACDQMILALALTKYKISRWTHSHMSDLSWCHRDSCYPRVAFYKSRRLTYYSGHFILRSELTKKLLIAFLYFPAPVLPASFQILYCSLLLLPFPFWKVCWSYFGLKVLSSHQSLSDLTNKKAGGFM